MADRRVPVAALVGGAWPSAPAGASLLTFDGLLARGLPEHLRRAGPLGLAADLRADPGPWLYRLLLAADVQRVAALVPNDHPDLADVAAQDRLGEVLRPKYLLRYRRSAPDPRHAIVEARAVDAARLAPAELAQRHLLDRAHGRPRSLWAEALTRLPGAETTRAQARAAVAATGARAPLLDVPLIEMPRHQWRELAAAVAASASARPA